jgi:anti-sigma regulatory factor (Ser/Thr protein kinase)
MVPLRQPCHHRYPIASEADVGAVRRAAAGYADQLHATEAARGRVELVATELATNLLRHAGPGGWLLLRPVPPGAVELIAVDRGPGIADPAGALDGRTPTPHGLGRGLAVIRRASAEFDLYTERDAGTVVLSLVDVTDGAPVARTCGGVSTPVAQLCGDGWAVAPVPDGLAVAVVDGLGHGAGASAAADAAIEAFAKDPADLAGYAARANELMRATRGGAVAVCRLRPERVEYLAVGNVTGRLVAGTGERGLTGVSGTLGINAAPPRVRLAAFDWAPGGVLVLWTDGLTSRIQLTGHPGLLRRHPAVIAAVLYRDHVRERDDATVVVLRRPERG